VTTNDEFQYYNNCYTIESQVTTVVNSRCPATHAFKPAVKVIVRNIRQDVAQIPKNSPIAVVKVRLSFSPVLISILVYMYPKHLTYK
jgi:hypothetical protein